MSIIRRDTSGRDGQEAKPPAAALSGHRPDPSLPDRHGMPARDRRAMLYLIAFIFDIGAIVLGYVLALLVRDQRWLETAGQPILVLALPVFVMIALAREVHSVETLESRLLGIQRALGALGATALILMGLGFIVNAEEVSRIGFAITFAAASVFMVLGKFGVDLLFKWLMDARAVNTLLIRDGIAATPAAGVEVVDLDGTELGPNDDPHVFDSLARLCAPYDRVVIACEYEKRVEWAAFLKGSDVGGEIILDRNLLLGAVGLGQYDNRDTLVMSLGPLNLVNRIQKRTLDVVTAGTALIVLSPLLLFVALAIRLDSPGPVLFRQRRVGQGNRHFNILKFRSMRSDAADGAGDRSASRDDERITRLGRFIRATSIDELPQLINVLIGDMSIVGPRPHALGSKAGELLFWQASDHYWLRHSLKPGLTGLAQIRGYRGATETEDDLKMRVRSDLEYLSSWSLLSDVIIMLKTVRVLIHRNAF